MNIIFLDFDGVTKTIENFHPSTEMGHFKFNERCMNNLNNILDVTGAKIVVSSKWRTHLAKLRAIFEKNGIDGKCIIDITPYLKDEPRGKEIQRWLDTKGKYFNKKGGKYKIEKFVILDDSKDMAHLQPYLIQTYPTDGITKDISSIIIDYFTSDRTIVGISIEPEERHGRLIEWHRNLSIISPKSSSDGATELMRVSQDIFSGYERDVDYTTLCYNHRFREITEKTRPIRTDSFRIVF